jgi:hypothetical protein
MTPLGGSMQMLSRQRVEDVIVQVERIDRSANHASTVIAGPFSQHAEVDHTLKLGVPIRGFCHIRPCAIFAKFVYFNMVVIANLSHAIVIKRNKRCATGPSLGVRIWSESTSVAIGAVVAIARTRQPHLTDARPLCKRGRERFEAVFGVDQSRAFPSFLVAATVAEYGSLATVL